MLDPAVIVAFRLKAGSAPEDPAINALLLAYYLRLLLMLGGADDIAPMHLEVGYFDLVDATLLLWLLLLRLLGGDWLSLLGLTAHVLGVLLRGHGRRPIDPAHTRAGAIVLLSTPAKVAGHFALTLRRLLLGAASVLMQMASYHYTVVASILRLGLLRLP